MIRSSNSIVERLNIFRIKNEQLINYNLEKSSNDSQLFIKSEIYYSLHTL